MTTYYQLLNDIIILKKAGLTSLLRIKYFLEIMRMGAYVPIEEYPENHNSVSAQCRKLTLSGQPHKVLAKVAKPAWKTRGRLAYIPTAAGNELYSELSSGLEKYISTLEGVGMRTLNDAAIFLFVSKGKTCITDLHGLGYDNELFDTVNIVNKTIDLGMGKSLQRSAAFKGPKLFSKKTFGGNRSSEISLTAAGAHLYKRATGD